MLNAAGCLPIVEPIAQVLETMAFISVAPVDAAAVGPLPRPLLARIGFTGPSCGSVEILASKDFAVLLAANVLGCSPLDTDAENQAHDALKELVNVVCGRFLADLTRVRPGIFEVGIPTMTTSPTEGDLQRFLAAPGPAVFDADGHILAARVSGPT